MTNTTEASHVIFEKYFGLCVNNNHAMISAHNIKKIVAEFIA
jgi:hypothetical protein